MSILQKLLDNNEVHLYADYRSGTFLDHSGNQTAVNDGGILKNKKAMFNFNTTCEYGVIGIGTNDFSILIKQKPYQYNAFAIRSDDVGGLTPLNITIYRSDGISLYFDRVYYNVFNTPADISQDNKIGWSCDRDGDVRVFYDGLFVGARDISEKSAVDVQMDAKINYKQETTRSDFDYVLIVKKALTDTEMAELTAELENVKFPNNVTGKSINPNMVYNNKLNNENFWTLNTDPTSGNNWTIESGMLKHNSIASTGLIVASVGETVEMKSGKTYEISFNVAELEPAGRFAIYLDDQEVNPYTTYFQTGTYKYTYTPTDDVDNLKFIASQVSNSFALNNIKISELKDVAFKTDWGVTANEKTTSDFIENTCFEINSGSFKTVDDYITPENVKVIECVTDGKYKFPTTFFEDKKGSGYGEWEFWFNKTETGEITVGFCNQNGIENLTPGDGYSINLNSSEQIILYNSDTILFSTSENYFENGVWHKIKITRTENNEFTVYLDDVLVTANTGTNPITDSSYTSANWILFEMAEGDKISLGDIRGEKSIIKR